MLTLILRDRFPCIPNPEDINSSWWFGVGTFSVDVEVVYFTVEPNYPVKDYALGSGPFDENKRILYMLEI